MTMREEMLISQRDHFLWYFRELIIPASWESWFFSSHSEEQCFFSVEFTELILRGWQTQTEIKIKEGRIGSERLLWSSKLALWQYRARHLLSFIEQEFNLWLQSHVSNHKACVHVSSRIPCQLQLFYDYFPLHVMHARCICSLHVP